jgi:hypothetical protein
MKFRGTIKTVLGLKEVQETISSFKSLAMIIVDAHLHLLFFLFVILSFWEFHLVCSFE